METGQEETVRAFNVRAGFAVDAKAPFFFFLCVWAFVPVFVCLCMHLSENECAQGFLCNLTLRDLNSCQG